MSLHLPLRPLSRSRPTTLLHHHRRVLLPQHRTIFGLFRRGRREEKQHLDPLSEQFLKKKNALKLPPQASPTPGSLDSSSIFADEDAAPAPGADPTDASRTPQPAKRTEAPPRNPQHTGMALDPHPKVRRRWERKMVIRSVRQRGRITRAVQLARTERQHLAKSPLLYTSVKKLMLLARQIAGKTVEDAIVQMRYSKKSAARDVLKQLELARDEAVVVRGMGLGKVNGTPGGKVEFRDKKGKRRVVEDRTGLYIDQAWVGRGKYTPEPEYRARGRIYILQHPQTSISLLLKEEATRIREAKERQEKKDNKKPWVHHPDRPIPRQTQYILW